jgi:hypothetical protein
MKPNIRLLVPGVVLMSALIIYGLVTKPLWLVLTHIVFMVVGFFVGSFLVLGAYRLFGWGEPAARSIVWWVGVGGGIILLLVWVVVEPVLRMPTFGVWMGSVMRAMEIRGQLHTEEALP